MHYVSVVSHNHFDLIKTIGALEKFRGSKQLTVIVRDNFGEPGFEDWCRDLNFYYFRNDKSYGFGKNNNLNFLFAERLGITAGDYFLTLNPDVDCTKENIINVQNGMLESNAGIATLNLFLDAEFTEFDNCVREFPGLWDFISSFLFSINKTIIDKNSVASVSFIDWTAGSFMMFKYETYKRLNGFDERYFMYCEDIDICWRYFKEYSTRVIFFRDIYGVHYARKENRKVLSPHFFWHIKSVIRYLLRNIKC
jgi:N-acetylglucosaminyl-diphospho-decaprenol L-rhamnosyltransferase